LLAVPEAPQLAVGRTLKQSRELPVAWLVGLAQEPVVLEFEQQS